MLIVLPVSETVPHMLFVSLVASDEIIHGEGREIDALLDRRDNFQVPGRIRTQKPTDNRGLREVFSKCADPIDESSYREANASTDSSSPMTKVS